jgi:hypothetical protein
MPKVDHPETECRLTQLISILVFFFCDQLQVLLVLKVLQGRGISHRKSKLRKKERTEEAERRKVGRGLLGRG